MLHSEIVQGEVEGKLLPPNFQLPPKNLICYIAEFYMKTDCAMCMDDCVNTSPPSQNF